MSQSLHLYDTATRSVRPFEPLQPGVVSLYNCGATVQWHPHIGHLRGAGIVYDSDPEKEWDETMNKGRALFRAVAEAAKGL